MRMTVIGCGYLGAVHAACMAALGHDVVGIDIDHDKVQALASGRSPFHEPGLDEILAQGTASGRLRFTAEPTAADLRGRGLRVETGRFGAMMEVLLVNDGPFTVLVEA